ncbi:MAG TPA: hypothetical protein IAC01_02050 [Candidatus Limicola stercorigallinarum]|nr:hypothetical protein [Candidatus Limicola stercorigallinarum]
MKRPAFLANFIIWTLIALGTTGYLAWYNLGGQADAASSEFVYGPAEILRIIAAPLLLFALGAVIGFLLIAFKNIMMGRMARSICRFAGIACLALFVAAIIPCFFPGTASQLALPTVVVVYVAMAAPIMIMMFGFLYALGLAPLDPNKPGPFDKYLPDDHFE